MAEAKDSKSKKRRIIREAETVREKAEKDAREPKEHTSRSLLGKVLYYITWPLRFAGQRIAKLQRFKIFRIIGYILVPPYFRNSFKELKQVTWPNRKETIQLTLAVIMFAIVFGTLVTGVDWGLEKVFRRILLG